MEYLARVYRVRLIGRRPMIDNASVVDLKLSKEEDLFDQILRQRGGSVNCFVETRNSRSREIA